MKSLKKEIFTIVTLLVVAVVGVYVVNASTTAPVSAPLKASISAKNISIEAQNQSEAALIAAGQYGCDHCETFRNAALNCDNPVEGQPCYDNHMLYYLHCRAQFDDCH